MAADDYINDYAGLISGDVEYELRDRLRSVEYYAGVEIVLVTIHSFDKYRESFDTWESFATALFNNWGIGNLPANDGVLLLVAKEGRKIRIELGKGYPKYFNSIMKSIIDDVIYPEFERNNFSGGIVSGSNKIIQAVTEPVSFFEWYKWYILAGFVALLSTIVALTIDKKKNPGMFWLLLASAGFIVLWIIKDLREGNASDGFGGGSSDGGGASGGD